ncbi:MAG: YbhB/YbcL family Raf kinase inhibitor-like protein [Vicinamibacterales bacterium]
MTIRNLVYGVGLAVAMSSAAGAQSLSITSPSFSQGGQIPSKFTCDAAAAVNPQLVFSNVPAKTAALVLIMDDPDVPKTLIPSGEFVHWLVWDLAPASKGIAEGDGKAGINGTGQPGYMGPCPPDKSHRYFFKLYAVDQKITGEIKNKAQLEKAMDGHILQKAELMANYEKVKK